MANSQRHTYTAIELQRTLARVDMEFITARRGQRKLIKDGYLYALKKVLANDITSWKCVLRRKAHCKARVKLHLNDDFVEQTNEHTYPPSQTNCQVVKVRAGIKQRATQTVTTNQQILAEQLTGISACAAANLPLAKNLRRNIHSARQERNLPPLSINITAIPVPLSSSKQQAEINFVIWQRC